MNTHHMDNQKIAQFYKIINYVKVRNHIINKFNNNMKLVLIYEHDGLKKLVIYIII
jgi:hypothetical protein